MAAMRGARLPVGSTPWVAEERTTALQVAQSEVEEFEFSARNEVEWLNEHMAEIFSENQINVADIFKTPGKLRGKTPRGARKANAGESRTPLADIFSATPKGAPNPFAIPNLNQKQNPKMKIAEDKPLPPSPQAPQLTRAVPSPEPLQSKPMVAFVDSGYHGSQSQDAIDIDDAELTQPFSPEQMEHLTLNALRSPDLVDHLPSPTQPTVDPTFHSAREEQTTMGKVVSPRPQSPAIVDVALSSPMHSPTPASSPVATIVDQSTTPKYSPVAPPVAEQTAVSAQAAAPYPVHADLAKTRADEIRSPSDGSSPIRPLVRKSSLNFASLPAREPLTSNKSLGARMSRPSHLDQARPSYFNRTTGGKSLGNVPHDTIEDEGDEMDTNDDFTVQTNNDRTTQIAVHNKTYTQRLQDQINMLGKSQATGPRPSKSIHATAPPRQSVLPAAPPQPKVSQEAHDTKPLPHHKKSEPTTPGAFPEDDEDDWIAPPATVPQEVAAAPPRPALSKSYSADVMEGVHGQDTVGDFELEHHKQKGFEHVSMSPPKVPARPNKNTSTFGHSKAASVPVLPTMGGDEDEDVEMFSPKKTISVSYPSLPAVSETGRPPTSPKSPSRNLRESPLRQVKNKLSSILKSSKGLLASSAAISAEGKSALMSPSMPRLGFHVGPSVESFMSMHPAAKSAEQLYPDLSHRPATDAPPTPGPAPVPTAVEPASPVRHAGRKTRASTEREKREQKQKEKDMKDAQRLADKQEKQEKALEKAREKEREKARVFNQEQEKIAVMERQIAAQRDQEKAAQGPPPPPKDSGKPTRASPRKAKTQADPDGRRTPAPTGPAADDDDEMIDAPVTRPPQSAPRTAGPTPASRMRELKRPVKPAAIPAPKAKQTPTVIRVNTGSQHPQFHPSNSVLAATLQDTLGSQSQQNVAGKASKASLHTKPSLQSLKSSVSSTGKPKALELAAKRKEQEEREAKRKREAKLDLERKRAAMQEEERKREQQRRLEADKQKEKDRDAAVQLAEAKKNAQRQAAIEKAKNTRAPPPAVRSNPHGPPDYQKTAGTQAQRTDTTGPSRPPTRLANSTMQRSQDDHQGRPVNAVLSNATKAAAKRPIQDAAEDAAARQAASRSTAQYQSKEGKRIRMSEEFDEDIDMIESQPGQYAQPSQPPQPVPPSQSNIKGPPVRPSAAFKRELPTKSMFPGGYNNVPPPSATRDLFKATVTAQHGSQAKPGHPLDTAQFSKGAIPFAPNQGAPSQAYKTPARPPATAGVKSTAKSAAKSSPRFPNGDAIELPEIQTDDEDDDDDANIGVAPWADSPDLRRALMRQETVDPMQIFGPPAPLNMEEVFNKSKDRWHKFRNRTSSANWSGSDRLTEDDIRKDLAARDRLRREGAWTYGLMEEK